jgi:hypothetical protein
LVSAQRFERREDSQKCRTAASSPEAAGLVYVSLRAAAFADKS